MKTTVDNFINATGREGELQDLMNKAESQLARLIQTKATYQQNANSWASNGNTFRNLSYDDWKERNKKDINQYDTICKGGQCRGQGKSGRGNRFDVRYDKAIAA